jgi:hypothetical protein
MFLSRPYPFTSLSATWSTTIRLSVFISLFLLIFQPFGLNEYSGEHKYLFTAGYGLVTFLVLSLDQILLRLFFRTRNQKKHWTIGKQIISLCFILFTIGWGNFLYSSQVFHFHNPWKGFLIFQIFTLAVGILPISLITILTEQIRNKQHTEEANHLNNSIHPKVTAAETRPLRFTADNEKDSLQMDSQHFLYAESSGNYLNITYLRDGKTKTALIRSTLKSAEMQVEAFPSIVKCHRAFLVNTDQIEQVKGNAQGLRIHLQHTEEEIPVSRSFMKDLKDKIQQD